MTAVETHQSETTVDAAGCSASTSFEFDGSELIRTLKIGDLEAKSAVTVSVLAATTSGTGGSNT